MWPGALLVAGEHVPHGRAARDRVVGRQDRAARDPERDVDALVLERAQDRVGAEHAGHRSTPPPSKCSTSVRDCRQQLDHRVGEARACRGRVPLRSAASPTARSSVRDAERRFRPSASISDAVSSIAGRIDDAEAGDVVGVALRRARRRRGRRRAATRARPWPASRRDAAAASTSASTRCASVTITSSDVGIARAGGRAPRRASASSTSSPSQRARSAATAARHVVESPTAATRPRRDAAQLNARATAISFGPVADRRRRRRRRRVRPTCTRATRHASSRSAFTPSNAGSSGDATRIASTSRYAVARRGRQRMPGARHAPRPRTADGRRRARAVQRRDTRSSARVAAAISSGPTPSPARQATVLVISILLSLDFARRRARRGRTTPALEVDVCGVQGRVSEISP